MTLLEKQLAEALKLTRAAFSGKISLFFNSETNEVIDRDQIMRMADSAINAYKKNLEQEIRDRNPFY